MKYSRKMQASFGFVLNKGKVEWHSPVLPEYLTRPAFAVYRERKRPKQQVIGLDDWRLIMTKPLKIWMCPGTASRRKLRIEGAFETLKPWINALYPNLTFESGRELPASLAYKAGDVDMIEYTRTCFGNEVAQLFDKPMGRVFFNRIGERVVLTFTPKSARASVNEMFDKGM